MKRIIDDITRFIFVNDEPSAADIIFIPGGSHPQPSERAADLYKQGFAPLIMPSGKYYVLSEKFPGVRDKADVYNGPYETEWDFMRDVLVKNGVPCDCILKECESTFTIENAVFSRRVCDEQGIKVKSAILCCKSFHARRALIYYQLSFPEADFYVTPSDVSDFGAHNWYENEYGFNRVMSELAKCGSQTAGDLKRFYFGRP